MGILPDDIPQSVDGLDRRAASRDLWPGGTLEAWQGRVAPSPAIVAWPESEEQVQSILRAAVSANFPIVPYGAGSGVCGGARGIEGSIAVDLKRLDRIGPLDAARRTVEVEAGVIGQHLEDWLEARGFTLGHSPSSIGCSTVGGWAAARSAGQFSGRYGVFEDMVLQLRAVSPACGAFTVGEGGNAPDDWMELLLGSEGTLAVITRLRLRVWPKPEVRWLRGYHLADLPSAIASIREVMQGELWPSVVRLYDPVDTWIGGRTNAKPSVTAVRMRSSKPVWFPRLRSQSLALPLSLPRLVNYAFGAMASGCLLVLGFEGDPAVVEAGVTAARDLLERRGARDLGVEPGERWFRSRHNVSYKLMPIFERGGFADTMEVACRWSDLHRLYTEVKQAVSRTAVVMAHMSHIYPEGGSIYFSFAGRGDRIVYDATWKAALEATLRCGATVAHHHGVGESKAWAASREAGRAVEGWRELKHRLDPVGVLNPGRVYRDDTLFDEDSPVPSYVADDGLVRGDGSASSAASWPREPGLPPPRWQRLPWQTPFVEVSGRVDGVRCMLGRAPRSSSGSDLRLWLLRHGSEVSVSVPAFHASDRAMGVALPPDPWRVAHELLRSDLRPAQVFVEGGALHVGFRGPAADAFLRVASSRVPGGLNPCPWQEREMPAGPLEACESLDPAVVTVTLEGFFRRASRTSGGI